MKCLFNQAEKLVSDKEEIEHEQQHLRKVFGYNGYPKTFISSSAVKRTRDKDTECQEDEVFIVIPYTKGLSEDIRRLCRGYGIKVVFKSGPTMRDRLVKVKDKLCTGKQSSVVYKIPCSCGKFYLGETVRRLGTRIKDACVHGSTEKSAVSDHAWTYHHSILWDEVQIVDSARRHDILQLKEALHIQTTDNLFNRDVGLEVPQCWPALLKLHK